MSGDVILTDRRPIGFWLKLVDRLIEDQLSAALSGWNLTRRHWQVLNVLQQGEASYEAIDERVRPFLAATEPSARPAVDDLIARDWAILSDGQVRITDQGAAEFSTLLTTVSSGRHALVAGISPEEYEATIAVLEQMARNLGWVPDE